MGEKIFLLQSNFNGVKNRKIKYETLKWQFKLVTI